MNKNEIYIKLENTKRSSAMEQTRMIAEEFQDCGLIEPHIVCGRRFSTEANQYCLFSPRISSMYSVLMASKEEEIESNVARSVLLGYMPCIKDIQEKKHAHSRPWSAEDYEALNRILGNDISIMVAARQIDRTVGAVKTKLREEWRKRCEQGTNG
jgi:hypothetical protein